MSYRTCRFVRESKKLEALVTSESPLISISVTFVPSPLAGPPPTVLASSSPEQLTIMYANSPFSLATHPEPASAVCASACRTPGTKFKALLVASAGGYGGALPVLTTTSDCGYNPKESILDKESDSPPIRVFRASTH